MGYRRREKNAPIHGDIQVGCNDDRFNDLVLTVARVDLHIDLEYRATQAFQGVTCHGLHPGCT